MRTAIAVIVFSALAAAQQVVSNTGVTGNVDNHAALKTLPFRTGTGSPNGRDNCATIGEMYFQTDGTGGQNTWGCTVTGTPGTWTLQSGGGGGSSAFNVTTGSGAPTQGSGCVAVSTSNVTYYFDTTGQNFWVSTAASGNCWQNFLLSTNVGPFILTGVAGSFSQGVAASRPSCSANSYYLASDTHALTYCNATSWSGTINTGGHQACIMNSTSDQFQCYDSNGVLTIVGTVTTTGSPSSGNMAKFSGAASITNAVAGTDFAAPTSGSVPLKGNGSGGFSAAVANDIAVLFSGCSGTQYLGYDGNCHSAGGGGSNAVLTAVSFSATPTFTVTASSTPQIFTMTLTGNVTGSTLSAGSATAGQQIGFILTQDGTGSRTFAWPSNVIGACTIDPVASVATTVIGVWNGSSVISPSCSSNDTWFGLQSPISTTTPTPVSGLSLFITTPSTGAWGSSINGGSLYRVPQVIFSGTLALATSAISGSGGCQTVTAGSVNSVAATGVTTSDVVYWSLPASIKAVTGYAPSSGQLQIFPPYTTAGYINFDVCNPTLGSITPGAVTLNLLVVR